MAEYRRPGGHIFEYETLRETGTNLWAVDGYLKSDPSVAIRTKTFKTKHEASLEFMKRARQIVDALKAKRPVNR
jgi:hypothetical protein